MAYRSVQVSAQVGSAWASVRAAPSLAVFGWLLLLGCGADEDPAAPEEAFASLGIVTATLPGAFRGVWYSEGLEATGGDGSYTWSTGEGDLPEGLELDASTGRISGVPVSAGVSDFSVAVASGDGQTAQRALSVAIDIQLVVSTTMLRGGVPGRAYSQVLTAEGGDAPYSWALVGGSLPAGLNLGTATGEIAGTPSQLETRGFTVEVSSGDGQTDRQGLSLVVGPSALLLPTDRCSDFTPEDIVRLEDANLEAELRTWFPSALGGPDWSCGLTASIAAPFEARAANIRSLAGLQNFTALSAIRLPDNEIADLEPLAGLEGSSLVTLHLNGNAITDVGPLAALDEELRHLILDGNEIHLLDPLRGLTLLNTLHLNDNAITDVGPLRGLTALVILQLRDNAIADLSPLGGLVVLQTLDLSVNAVTDVAPLRDLGSLTRLHLGGNSITDVSALGDLTGLEELSLGGNPVTDVGSLSALSSLKGLTVGGTFDAPSALADISSLSGLTGLERLSLSYASVSDLTALSGMTALVGLVLWDNEVSDITALAPLTNLENFSAPLNSITDISALGNHTALTTIQLQDNRITSVDGLADLQQVTQLYLDDNEVTDIRALESLTSLSDLRLVNNGGITDLRPLVDNVGLGAGDQVNAGGTNPTCADLTALRDKGVTVFFGGACR